MHRATLSELPPLTIRILLSLLNALIESFSFMTASEVEDIFAVRCYSAPNRPTGIAKRIRGRLADKQTIQTMDLRFG